MRRFCLWLAAAVLPACAPNKCPPPVTAAPGDLTAAALVGGRLSKARVDRLEKQVARQPDAADAADVRARLLGYYFMRRPDSAAARAARAPHVVWMVQNRPADDFTGTSFCGADEESDAETFAQAKASWEAQVAAHPTDVRVLGNAASFFDLSEPETARALLARAAAAEPANGEWPGRLAQLDARGADSAGDAAEKQRLRAVALENQVKSIELAADPADRFYQLTDVPEYAIEAGRTDEAAARAKELLETAEQFRDDWNYGNAVHKAHIALGRLALAAGDVEGAKRHLLAAGQMPGSPQLNSFGPNTRLALDLLRAGERDAVLEYLGACRRFWKLGGDALDEWTKDIRAGREPEFGPTLVY